MSTADAADDAEEAEADEAEAEAVEPDDVPVFLAEAGKLLLFRSPEGLVEYVRGSADHELAQLDTWAELKERIEPDDIVPLDEDRYELDLVVENLRGGHDAWDPELIIQAGEVARDIAFALRLPPILSALAPGSPLDDLDEGLRTVEAGGFGSFFAKRRVRKIDPQTTAALGWRTIIGKISAVVDWRNCPLTREHQCGELHRRVGGTPDVPPKRLIASSRVSLNSEICSDGRTAGTPSRAEGRALCGCSDHETCPGRRTTRWRSYGCTAVWRRQT